MSTRPRYRLLECSARKIQPATGGRAHSCVLQGPKVGDKLLLRELLKLYGFPKTASRPKRAVQFGTRISAQANKRDFGSNRAANAVNAGSMKLSRALECAPQAKILQQPHQ